MSKAPEFIPAEELKKHFDVFGLFYNISASRYRSCLEIVRKNCMEDSSSLIKRKPDALVVMMNPGSSRPLHSTDKSHEVKSFSEADKLLLKGKFIPAHPDPTQYQVERVMHRMKWNHVRVINLADVREPKSYVFTDSIRKKNPYSIFSEERRTALLQLCTNETVICGWGMDRKLTPLIDPAVDFLKENQVKVIGQANDAQDIYFRHPSPMMKTGKMKWLEDVWGQLK